MCNYIDILSLAASVMGLIIALITLYFAWRIPYQIMINQQLTQLHSEYRTVEMGDAIFSIMDFFVNDCKNEKTGKPDVELIKERYKVRYEKEIKEKTELYRECLYKKGEDTTKCQQQNKLEMGDAIFFIMDFFVNDCKNEKTGKPDVKLIKEKTELYRECLYKKCEDTTKCQQQNKLEYDPAKTLHFKRRLVDYFFWLLGDLLFNPYYPVKLPRKQVRNFFSKNERYLLHIIHHMNAASKEFHLNAKPIEECKCGCPSDNTSPMDIYREKLIKEAEQWGKESP